MKKLMIALAAVACAAGIQAASVNWASTSDSNFKGYGGNKLATTMPVYLIDSAYIDTIKTAINNGTIGNVDEHGDFVTQGVIAEGTFGNTRGSITQHPVSNDALVYNKGVTTYAFAQLIIDNKNGATGEIWYNISQAQTQAAYDPTKTDEFAATDVTFTYEHFESGVSQTGGWVKASAVPEPTSGLLLLLGMAGLALRRRRA